MRRIKVKELFELKDCETIQTDSGIDINKFNISKYITNEFEFEFSYDKDNNNVAQVTMSYVPDQRVDLFTMDADHKDLPLFITTGAENIIMHHRGGIVYEKTSA